MPMTSVSIEDALSDVCRSRGKWGMFVRIYSADLSRPELDEIQKAAPYLDVVEHGQIIVDGEGYLLFDNELEMLLCYEMTVGDDGPTATNPYSGPARVSALTCGPDGQLGCNNT